MAELRNIRDGVVVWRGDDPAECLAAMAELGEDAIEHIVVGFDSSHFMDNGEPVKPAGSPEMISDPPPPPTFDIINEQTGAVEQSWETREGAQEATDVLNDQAAEDGIAHMGEDVTFVVRSPLESP